MVIIYTTPSNRPSREAVQWFKRHNVPFTERRITQHDRLSVKTLKRLIAASEDGVDSILARRSTSLKSISGVDAMSLNDLLQMMSLDSHLIHFPLIFDDERNLLVTHGQEELGVFISHKERIAEMRALLASHG
ncbi:ArsC/Spx/MgsR family protein [Furfurilactobacillus rossiae]|uniref:ArsC/Spx/MgsR family protein n=1 Tax=Furfurilactobacillus rossiae TaxID=231049 RepID=UPI0015B90297|nr:ArsC/Spx/MgsR family protein [Furfurilactobacillus rossiae]MCF6166066.1 hypothetical protein [Furfurilactobacillus rossiae]